MKKRIVLVLLGLLSINACASIMHGTEQDVGISSIPTSALVTIDGLEKGKTPVVAKLKRKDNHTIVVSLEGYQPYELALTKKVSGWVLGNIIFGGLIGLAVDAIDGAIYALTPEQIQAAMLKKDHAAAKLEENLFIAVVMTPDPAWQKIGQAIR